MIYKLFQASVTRFHQAKNQLLLYWTESGECKHCHCIFSPTDLLRQQIKMIHTHTKSDKTALAYKK